VKHSFRAANADVEAWLKVIMAPLEAQIRQHRDQLRHRQASIQRIHDATESLEQKIAAFEGARHDLDSMKARLGGLSAAVARALDTALDTALETDSPEPETA
jgi:chromosome segregation ATPase